MFGLFVLMLDFFCSFREAAWFVVWSFDRSKQSWLWAISYHVIANIKRNKISKEGIFL